jgi:hypothetical protein
MERIARQRRKKADRLSIFSTSDIFGTDVVMRSSSTLEVDTIKCRAVRIKRLKEAVALSIFAIRLVS